jgi:hypothetical protein
MTRWGSVNLKGVFLDADIVAAAGDGVVNVSADLELGNDSSESGTEARSSEVDVLEITHLWTNLILILNCRGQHVDQAHHQLRPVCLSTKGRDGRDGRGNEES